MAEDWEAGALRALVDILQQHGGRMPLEAAVAQLQPDVRGRLDPAALVARHSGVLALDHAPGGLFLRLGGAASSAQAAAAAPALVRHDTAPVPDDKAPEDGFMCLVCRDLLFEPVQVIERLKISE